MKLTTFPRRVFFAFDAEQASLDGLAAVRALTERFGCELVVGHVVDAQSPPLEAEERAKAMLREMTSGSSDAIGDAEAPELKVTRADDVAEGVIEAAEECEADLLALTTHDRKGLARFFGSSVTEDVVARAHMPVLSLREDEASEFDVAASGSRILVPVAFDEHDGAVLAVAKAWARALGAEVDLLHVVGNPHFPVTPVPEAPVPSPTLPPSIEIEGQSEEDVLQLWRGIPGPDVAVQAAVARGDVGEQVRLRAEQGGHQLVVMGTAGKKGLVRLLLGSVARHVLRSVGCPVVLIPPTVRLSTAETADDAPIEYESMRGRRFSDPREVLAADWLSDEEKRIVLEDWKLDELRYSESTSEGMEPTSATSSDKAAGGETLAEIESALRRLRGEAG